mmetsp:Transcript_78615/g.163398  ORF Transcript_78615/g.163398 Transcript_78615/m.163398 type:complete len:114 (+) Transcript_78615:1823-2164(+)
MTRSALPTAGQEELKSIVSKEGLKPGGPERDKLGTPIKLGKTSVVGVAVHADCWHAANAAPEGWAIPLVHRLQPRPQIPEQVQGMADKKRPTAVARGELLPPRLPYRPILEQK